VRRSFLAAECVEPRSAMTNAIIERFFGDREAMLEWSNNARPREWAEFARTVFDHASQSDPVALQLVMSNASAVERILDRMIDLGATRIALMGGIAAPTRPYLKPRFDGVIVDAQGDAMDGALLLASRAMQAARRSQAE